MTSNIPQKKPLTAKQKQILKKSIVRMKISDKNIIAYCLANKQSKSGIFSNQRLLLLHSGQKSLRYYSNLPQSLPFTHPSQVKDGKQKIYIDHVNKFRCSQVKGKNSTMMIEWEFKNEKNSWIFGLGTPKMMYEWIALVQEMIDGKLQVEDLKKQEEQQRKREEEKRETQKREEQKRRIYEENKRRQEEEERVRNELRRRKDEQEREMQRIFLIENRKKQQQSRRLEEERLVQENRRNEEQKRLRQLQEEYQRQKREKERQQNERNLKNSGPIKQQKRYFKQEPVNLLSPTEQKNYFPSKKAYKSANITKWNELWCTSRNPIQIYQNFTKQCQQTACKIIEQLLFLKNDRQFTPYRVKSPFSIYLYDGIQYKVHCFSQQTNILEQESRDDLPILFHHETYRKAKRQFYNYNFIVSVTGNKGYIKVPMCYYVEYKGVLVACKATVSQNFQKVQGREYEKQFQSLENVLKLRFYLSSLSLFSEPSSKYLIIQSLDELLPEMPESQSDYFRRQIVMQSEIMIEDRQSLMDLYTSLTDSIIPEFVQRLESIEFWIINSADLLSEMHKVGINAGLLSEIYLKTNTIYYKKLFISEMVSNIFTNIMRSQLNNVFSTFPASEMQNLSIQKMDNLLIKCVHVLINQFFSYSSKSEAIWRTIVKQVKQVYNVVISKEDIIPGYLFGAIINKMGLQCDYKCPQFSRDITFFVKEDTIPQNLLISFTPKQRRYNLQSFCSELEAIDTILSQDPSPDNYEQLVNILDLRKKDIPSFCKQIRQPILTYMCNFIPFGDHEEFEHLGIYDSLETEPHTFHSTKITLLAIKWAIKKKNEGLASKIFEVKFEENIFWVSQFNPAISQFYDFFALYYVSVINFDEGIKLAKSSLINILKLLGNNALPVSDKHYQLGNIFFKAGKKEESLKQYSKTKQILQHHKQTTIPEYGVILLKLSLLYLNFGKIIDCVGYALQTLKIIDHNGGNQEEQIQTFQILARAYEITRKKTDIINVGAISMQKFNLTENPKIFERMIKIVLMPRLNSIHPQDAKALLNILTKLQAMQSPLTYLQAFSYLRHRAQEQVIMKRVISYIENISDINEQINRRDLYRKHRSLNYETQSESGQTLVVLETVAVMVGYNFLIGSVRQNYYG